MLVAPLACDPRSKGLLVRKDHKVSKGIPAHRASEGCLGSEACRASRVTLGKMDCPLPSVVRLVSVESQGFRGCKEESVHKGLQVAQVRLEV